MRDKTPWRATDVLTPWEDSPGAAWWWCPPRCRPCHCRCGHVCSTGSPTNWPRMTCTWKHTQKCRQKIRKMHSHTHIIKQLHTHTHTHESTHKQNLKNMQTHQRASGNKNPCCWQRNGSLQLHISKARSSHIPWHERNEEKNKKGRGGGEMGRSTFIFWLMKRKLRQFPRLGNKRRREKRKRCIQNYHASQFTNTALISRLFMHGDTFTSRFVSWCCVQCHCVFSVSDRAELID